MSEQEREGRMSGSPEEEAEVEAHGRKRHLAEDAEAPESAGERTEDMMGEEPDVEAHARKRH